MEENKIKEQEMRRRLALYYEDTLGISRNKFEENMGKHCYIKGFNGKLRGTTQKLFAKVYPALNMNWVLSGKGSMLNPGYELRAMEIHPIHEKTKDTQSAINVNGNVSNSNNTIIGVDIQKAGNDQKVTIEELMRKQEENHGLILRLMERLMDVVDKMSQPCK